MGVPNVMSMSVCFESIVPSTEMASIALWLRSVSDSLSATSISPFPPERIGK